MARKRPAGRKLKPTTPLQAIRNGYAELGVEGFYRDNGATYCNPHFSYIAELIRRNHHQIDCRRVLDFCCGSGEVSQVLSNLGYDHVEGCDPFTQKAYTQRMDHPCLPYSFDDVIRGKLSGKQYTSVICSFAMHLCPPKKLYPLTRQLFDCSPQLIVITPHKRPALEILDGIRLDFEDAVLTERGKAVRLKGYSDGLLTESDPNSVMIIN